MRPVFALLSLLVAGLPFLASTSEAAPADKSRRDRAAASESQRLLSSRPTPPLDGPVAPPLLRASRRDLVPLVAGPAGDLGTVALPSVQGEASMAAGGLQVVAGYNDFRAADFSGVLYSADGGNTFVDGGQLPPAPGTAVLGDPALAVWTPPVGPRVFYYVSLFENAFGDETLCLHRSFDGGATWAGPFEIPPATFAPPAFADRPAIDVDPETGRLLVSWTQFNAPGRIQLTYSDDADAGLPPTWAPAIVVASRAYDGIATTVAADPNSDRVYIVWEAYPFGYFGNVVSFASSASNGALWGAPTDITPVWSHHLCPYGFDRWLWSVSGSSVAVNPADGGIEVVYAASVDGTPANDFGDIYYLRSTNGGLTWTLPVALNVFPTMDRPQAFPAVAASSDGRIDVYWYDQSIGSGVSDLTDLFYCFSSDFAATWSSPVPVTSSPFPCESGNNFSAPHQGDYIDAHSGSPARVAFTWMAPPSPLTTGADGMVFTNAAPAQAAPLRVRPGTVVVDDRGCGLDDGILVANESADLTIPLESIGRGLTTGISATLSALTPGISVQPGARSYPAIPSGGSAVSTDVYRIGLDAGYPCGTPARFRLDISATGVSPTFVEFELPTGLVSGATLLLSQNFDAVAPPALPAGWISVTAAGAPNPWVTTAVGPSSPPNAAFAADVGFTSFTRLFSPAVAVPAGTNYVEVTFDTNYDLETYDDRFGFDGASLEYQLDGAGGSHFASGDAVEFDQRYTHNLARSSGTAGDRSGWSGSSLGYRSVRVRIPGLAGHTLQPRFDLTCDETVGATGQWVDNVKIVAYTLDCGPCNPTPVLVSRFEARSLRDAVLLFWRVEASGSFTGWNLYRSSAEEGPFTRLNAEPIAMVQAGEFRFVDAEPSSGSAYYRLAVIQEDGAESVVQTLRFTPAAVTFSAHLAGPNPVFGGTRLRYSVPERTSVRIELFSVTGQRVRTLLDRVMDPGTYTAEIDLARSSASLGAGVYLVRVTAGQSSRTLRLVALEE